MKWYRFQKKYDAELRAIEINRETEKCIYFNDTSWAGGREIRESKCAEWHEWFSSLVEAQSRVARYVEREQRIGQERINSAAKLLEQAMGLEQ